MILLRFEAMRVRSQFFLAEKNGQIFFRSFLIELCQQPGACQEICHGRGGGNFVPTRKNFAPPPKLILCKIYHFISSFGLQKSYHSKPKIMDFKRLGGGLNHLGGGMSMSIVPSPMVRQQQGRMVNSSNNQIYGSQISGFGIDR